VPLAWICLPHRGNSQPFDWLNLNTIAPGVGGHYALTDIAILKGALYPIHLACAWALGSDEPCSRNHHSGASAALELISNRTPLVTAPGCSRPARGLGVFQPCLAVCLNLSGSQGRADAL
jgi:hypothetical protein